MNKLTLVRNLIHASLPQIRKLAQHLNIGVFFLEDPGEFCQQTQVFLSVMFLNVALHIQEFLRTEGRENVLMVTLGYGILVTVVDLRVLVTLFYSMELWRQTTECGYGIVVTHFLRLRNMVTLFLGG